MSEVGVCTWVPEWSARVGGREDAITAGGTGGQSIQDAYVRSSLLVVLLSVVMGLESGLISWSAKANCAA
jgi:hypothetical protein